MSYGRNYGGGGNPYAQQGGGGNPYAQQGGGGGNPYAQQNQYGQQEPAGSYGRGGGNPYAQQGGGGNPYAQQGGGGNPYAQQSAGGRGGGGNPYAQQSAGGGGNPYAQQDDYGARPAQGGYGRSNDVEMGQVGGGYGQAAGGGGGGRDILNECRSIDSGIKELEQMVQRLKGIQNASLQSGSTNPNENRELDQTNSEILNFNRNLVERIKKLKGTPGAGSPTNERQVKLVDEKLRKAFQDYSTADMEYQRKFRAQIARQYRIANPNATEKDARDAAENPEGGVFAQALLQSDRRGQAQTTLREVQNRHEAIQNVERQMEELATLFTQMNEIVLQQEPVVTRIAEQSENVTTDVTNANTHLDGAIEKARSRNKKKWWCLGLTILIILIIIGAVVAWYFTLGPGAAMNKKSS